MYKKIQSLRDLLNTHINVHEFRVPENYTEFKSAIKEYDNLCTIRCDHNILTKDLPFYIVYKGNEDFLKEMWEEAEKKDYKLIVANGLKHDKSQKYNLVVKFTGSGEFIAEVSAKKVPLRHMYRYPSELLSVSGNIDDNIGDWTIYRQVYGIDRRVILHELRELFSLSIFEKWLECTFYPYPVGVYNKDYVVWQIAD